MLIVHFASWDHVLYLPFWSMDGKVQFDPPMKSPATAPQKWIFPVVYGGLKYLFQRWLEFEGISASPLE